MLKGEPGSWTKEARKLIEGLALIPSPTGKEAKKAGFIRDWLVCQGAQGTQLDEAGNVRWLWGDAKGPLTVFMAHMDTVFPEETPLAIVEKEGRLYCPGIGDDTANLACMLMAAKAAAQSTVCPRKGILFAATVGEEGLGNLKGSRQLFKDYGARARQAVCFDLYREAVTCQAVGSVRYEISLHTKGGHSYSDFGNASAIAAAAELIHALYHANVPSHAKTTYNVGTIRGGTTINSIASEAEFTYEFRSVDQGCLDRMEEGFERIVRERCGMDARIEVRRLGARPCNGAVPKERLEALTQAHQEILQRHTEKKVQRIPCSTDANIPLSMGIPAVNIGTILGGGLHTAGEYIETDSIGGGVQIALECLALHSGFDNREEDRNDLTISL